MLAFVLRQLGRTTIFRRGFFREDKKVGVEFPAHIGFVGVP